MKPTGIHYLHTLMRSICDCDVQNEYLTLNAADVTCDDCKQRMVENILSRQAD